MPNKGLRKMQANPLFKHNKNNLKQKIMSTISNFVTQLLQSSKEMMLKLSV
jgi:hypothetical protein